jgi:two-component system, NtrC family, sensor histidine kinase PilS
MNQQAYTLIFMTAVVAGLIAILVFAVLRFAAAARDSRRHLRQGGMETALLSQALEDAITQLKAQERAMAARAEASERLSGQIVASLTAGLVVTDLDGRVQIVNPSSRRLLGLGDGPLEGTVREMLGATSPLTAVIEECLRERLPIVRRALELADVRTAVTHLGVTVSPLVSEAGTPSGVICLFTDLSAIVDLEEQLRLKDTLARLGELTAGLAHEFRNGLATVHGYARLLNLDTLPPQERKYVQGLRTETEALGQVVTNFLNFARPTQLAVTPVDLGQVAQRVAEELQADVTTHGGRLSVSGTWAVVDGDEVLLRQALSNLARNAVEACVGAGIVPDVRLEAATDAATRALRVQVTDNGPGIDLGLRDRVFRPFFTTKRDGTGLGLALVQKIVVTHNGRVQAGPGPGGVGTTMLVTLPLPEVLPKVSV